MDNKYLDMIDYININKLHDAALRLANKVGNIYVAMEMIYDKIELTDENIKKAQKISELLQLQKDRDHQELLESVRNY